MAQLGYQFQPDEERRLRQNLNKGGSDAGQFSPDVSQALKILSLRLPNVLGGRPMAPDDLLRPSVGGAGGNIGAVLASNLGAGTLPPEMAAAGSAGAGMRPPTSQPFQTLPAPGRDLGPLSGGGPLQPGRPNITPNFLPGDVYPGDTPAPPPMPLPPSGGPDSGGPNGPDQGPTGDSGAIGDLLDLFLRRPQPGDWRMLNGGGNRSGDF